MKQIKSLYTLIPKTDIHVGAGGEVAGIIDNLIQRNSTTGFPCIHSSSLKGALKQHCYHNGMTSEEMKTIFGSDISRNIESDNDNLTNAVKDESIQGNTAFGQAELLALAVPSDKTMFLLLTSPEVLDLYLENLKINGLNISDIKHLIHKINSVDKIITQAYAGAITPLNNPIGNQSVDFNENEKILLKSIFGEHYSRLAIISNERYIELTSDFYLPVAAHNALEDGKSDNLFYTQSLPMLSVCYFINVSKNEIEEKSLNDKIELGLVHIGANFSTSQGFCKINQVKLL